MGRENQKFSTGVLGVPTLFCEAMPGDIANWPSLGYGLSQDE
jgi:hypothetical protein